MQKINPSLTGLFVLMKHIPNIFTLSNLLFGCLALVAVLMPGLTELTDEQGQFFLALPEQMAWASLFVGIAAVIDFLDGFVARLLKVPSEMGKQLDSLADVVSFGVVPGMMIFQFLRYSFAQQPNGLSINYLWLLPAFIFPCAGAYRLARFNIDTQQTHGFKGVPIPAAGILIAAFPLIQLYTPYTWVQQLLANHWFWYAVVATISALMVSTLPMLALKFKQPSWRTLWPFIVLVVVAVLAGWLLGWLSVPVTFVVYIILSLFHQST